MELRPLSEGNALQRAYARWAAPHYARMPAELREQAELMDRFLYSRSGLGVWLGIFGSIAGTTVGLRYSGLSLGPALAVALLVWGVLPFSLATAWLMPKYFSGAMLRRKFPLAMVLAMAGGVSGFVFAQWTRHGTLDPQQIADALWRGAALLVPSVAAAAAAWFFLTWGVARVRQQMLERVIERERLAHERDSAARQAAEARLQLLQAQIQPHFIFNTLAAVQHWVDTADPRAGPLLRSLTAFLRGSTELLARERSQLGDEVEMARHYLAILQSRLGERLRAEIELDPAVAARELPPGLLLTLVENAIEHGIAPALSGGTLRLQAWQETGGWALSVSDDGLGLAADWQEGLGLANCRQRLAHHFGARASLAVTRLAQGTQACIRVQDALQEPRA